MADSDETFVTAVCLQYIIIGAASILISRKHRRRRQYWVKPWIRMRNVCGAYHSLFQQLLTTDAQSFQNFMRMDFVAFEDVLSHSIGVCFTDSISFTSNSRLDSPILFILFIFN